MRTHTFKNEVLPRCNPHREHGLSSDIKGHGEAAGRKWHVSRAPGGVCIWKEDKEEQEVCLRVRKDEGLSKSEPVPDRRSPHSVTLHQPHFTRQIYLPGPSPSCHFHWKSLFFFSSSPLVTTAVCLPSHCESGQFRSCCRDDVTPDPKSPARCKTCSVGVSSSACYLQRNSCVSCPSVLRRWGARLFNVRQISGHIVTTARGLAVSRTCSK